MAAERSSIFPILLVNFIGSMGFSIVLPFIVILVLKLGGNELSYGFLGATYSFFQLIGAPILGDWSDKYGRKKILLLSEAGSLAAWILFLVALYLPVRELAVHAQALKVFANTIPLLLLFIARAVDGLTGGNISVANAYLADVSTKEDRKKNFGKMSASANIGFIVGPALAGVLGATALGISLPVIAAIFVSLLSLATIAFRLKDIKPRPVTKPVNAGRISKVLGAEPKECYIAASPAKNHFLTILKLPYISYFLMLYFLIFLGFNFFYVAFPIYVVQQLQWNVLQLGIFFALLSGAMVIVQGPVLSRLSSRIRSSMLVIAGNLLLAVSFALFCSSSVPLLYLGLLFFALGNGIMWPSFLALLANASDDKYQGVIQGFASSTGSLASIIGLVSGAFLYRIMGSAIFLVTTAFMILIAISSYWLIGIEKKTG